MPRYITKEEQAHNAKRVNQIVAETEAELAFAEDHRQWRQTILRDRTPYGRGSEYSFFHDLAASRTEVPDVLAVERLNRQRGAAAKEQRAITTSTMGGIVPIQPLWTEGVIMEAVRSGAPLYQALTKLPLPPQVVTVQFSKFSAGSAAQVQNPEHHGLSQ
jgi:hypothetical protein